MLLKNSIVIVESEANASKTSNGQSLPEFGGGVNHNGTSLGIAKTKVDLLMIGNGKSISSCVILCIEIDTSSISGQ